MRLVKLLVGLVAGAMLLSGCGTFSVYNLPLPGGPDAGSDALTVKAQFEDVLDLVPQSTVKLDDVNVGKIDKVWLDNGVATVQMKIRKDVKLPTNTRANIEQSSLLGEKYVALETPDDPAPTNMGEGATIPLSQTGRNPEVEEVLGALSLVLNGGGVAQLKTISTELNKALAGREDSARSVLTQLNKLVTQLDNNKAKIVNAIKAVDGLSKETQNQMGSIDAALDELPSAVASINKQRGDLVKMLKALDQLGESGVRVIKASKENVVKIVHQLNPVLQNLAASGDHFVQTFNTLLTYPFVDAAVGTTPQAARNTHMGDFVNLDITLDLDVGALKQLPGVAGTICSLTQPQTKTLESGSPKQIRNLIETLDGKKLCESLAKKVDACQSLLVGGVADLLAALSGQSPTPSPTEQKCGSLTTAKKSSSSSGSGSSSSDSGSDGLGLGSLLGLNRAPSAADGSSAVSLKQLSKEYDPGLVTLMVPTLATSSNTQMED